MLKFFRKYNKYILIVGMVMLMVAFLIQGTISLFFPKAENVVVGTIGDQQITRGAWMTAGAELQVLSRIPLVERLVSEIVGNDGMHWLLMVSDARRLGISASDGQVRRVLAQPPLSLREADLKRIANSMNAKTAFVEQAVRHWLIVEAYAELMTGRSHMPVSARLINGAGTLQAIQQGYLHPLTSLRTVTDGSHRLSKALIKRSLYDQRSMATAKAVLIKCENHLDAVDPPDEPTLDALFNAHRSSMPGTSVPFGFGYHIPGRVKIEYLTIQFDLVRKQIRIEEADALDYYDGHRSEFIEPPPDVEAETSPDVGRILPYDQVRDQIVDQLTDQKADELAEQMVNAARADLTSKLRPLAKSGGYVEFPEDFQPLQLSVVADRLTEQFGVQPQVQTHGAEWTTVPQLNDLPQIGTSWLNDRRFNTPFAQYVLSAKEFKPAPDNPLARRRLQVNGPSLPMWSPDGSRHVFRLTSAEPPRDPVGLAEVRGQVVRDARKQAAYEKLVAERDTWLTKARTLGLKALADEVGSPVVDLESVPRREQPRPLSLSTIRSLPEIGISEPFVEALFAVAERAGDPDGLDDLSAAERTGVIGLDSKLALAVFRLDGYEPMTESQFRAEASSPITGFLINQTVMRSNTQASPLSFDAVVRRVEYVSTDE